MKNKLKKKFNHLGFTLIELIVFMGILSILLFILTDIFVATLNVKSESESQAAVQQDGRYILAKLMYDINQASDVLNPSYGSESTILTIKINDSEKTYSTMSANLYITDTENSDVLNSVDTQISDIKFTNLGNKLTNLGNPGKSTIQVSFTLTSKMIKNTGPEVESFKTTVGLR